MLNGLFDYNIWFGVFGSLGIVLSAVYMLSMVQKTFYGNANPIVEKAKKMSRGQGIVLFILVITILILGIYPEPVIRLTETTVSDIIGKISLK